MWLNSDMGQEILSGILAYYRFPDRTFVGSPEAISRPEGGIETSRPGGPLLALHRRTVPPRESDRSVSDIASPFSISLMPQMMSGQIQG